MKNTLLCRHFGLFVGALSLATMPVAPPVQAAPQYKYGAVLLQRRRQDLHKNGKTFTQSGGDFPMHFTRATFQDEHFGIFDYNPAGSRNWLDVNYFHQDGAARPR